MSRILQLKNCARCGIGIGGGNQWKFACRACFLLLPDELRSMLNSALRFRHLGAYSERTYDRVRTACLDWYARNPPGDVS